MVPADITYDIAEIFYSLQGEGSFSGCAAIFVRLAGCSMNCPWCDTDYKKKQTLTIDEIIENIKAFIPEMWAYRKNQVNIAPFIVITGGEPAEQRIHYLLEELKKELKGCYIQIESNGEYLAYLEDMSLSGLLDFITVSPKIGVESWVNINFIKECSNIADEIKIVYSEPELLEEWVEAYLPIWKDVFSRVNLFLQPCSEQNYDTIIKFIKKYPIFRLSLQTQKILDIR